jgi:hypothetical protein
VSGNKEGAKKATLTKLDKYGADYFAHIGRKGGLHSTPGGFGTDKVGKDGLIGPERAKVASRKRLLSNADKDIIVG